MQYTSCSDFDCLVTSRLCKIFQRGPVRCLPASKPTSVVGNTPRLKPSSWVACSPACAVGLGINAAAGASSASGPAVTVSCSTEGLHNGALRAAVGWIDSSAKPRRSQTGRLCAAVSSGHRRTMFSILGKMAQRFITSPLYQGGQEPPRLDQFQRHTGWTFA